MRRSTDQEEQRSQNVSMGECGEISRGKEREGQALDFPWEEEEDSLPASRFCRMEFNHIPKLRIARCFLFQFPKPSSYWTLLNNRTGHEVAPTPGDSALFTPYLIIHSV